MPNNRIHSDKIKLRRFALQLYFSGDAGRYAASTSTHGAHMQLKHFISETLSQLIDGVVEAQTKVQASGGRVSPHVHTPNDPKSLYGRTNDKLPVIFVDFDIYL